MKKTSEANSTEVFFFLFIQNHLCQIHRIDDAAVFVYAHISAGDLIDQDDFIPMVTEFKLDII